MNLPLRPAAFSILLLPLLFPGALMAQPDAGTILQEQRQLQPQLPDRLPKDEPHEEVRPPLADEGLKVLVRSFRFSGRYEGMATEAELQTLVSHRAGQELGFAELQHLAAQVTRFLREQKGYLLARAYLPRQEISEGVVEIAILAGRIDGRVRIDLRAPARVRPDLLQRIADNAVPADSPARMERIERAVLLMNDLPGIDARASLLPGSVPGTTSLIVSATEGPLLHGLLSGDAYGDRYTGDLRATGQFALDDPSGRGDRLTLSLTGAERLLHGRASYTLPLPSGDWTWNAAYTGLAYRLGRELEVLDAEGRAATFATGLTYPLVRSRRVSLWTGIGFEYLFLSDKANGAEIRDRRLPVGNVSLSGRFFDAFGGGGLTSTGLALDGGSVGLSGHAANKLIDAAGPGTQGGFTRASYSLARLQRLTRDLALFASLRGQWASGNLDSSQKFILGGPVGVRAYPVGEAPGDEGQSFTLETRYDLPLPSSRVSLQFVPFVDCGRVKLHRDPWPGAITTATGRNAYWLSGAGAGVNLNLAGRYSLRLAYAHTLGPNEGRSPAGTNSDNRDDKGRFWMQLLVGL